MKAAVYLGPKSMEARNVPDPVCAADEVVIRVEACAVCGTDVRIFNFGHKNVQPPQVIGHEIAGSIAAVGSRVPGWKVGQRVTVATPVGCGECRYCKKQRYNLCQNFKALGYNFPGGFAQYMPVPGAAVRQGNIIPLPDNVTFEQAALVEPLSCVVNGQEYLKIVPGDSVVVFGAGPIGCMHVELAKAKGAGKVFLVDVSPERLDLARRFGADAYINPAADDPVKRVIQETDGYGADVAICAASAPKVNVQALQLTAKGGRISYFAGLPKDQPTIEFDANQLHYSEISVFGAYASNIPQYRIALDFVASGKVVPEKFITSKFPLEELGKQMGETDRLGGLKMLALPQL